MNAEKDRRFAGADERTPSKAEYFSWINNTNEGSTEEHTLINLDYFAYLKNEYGMSLDIYAWDAGNLDGADCTYETPDSPKLKAQYPKGYGPTVEKAREIGCRMGVWGGIDGYGDTEESARERVELLVSLARDLDFALFKFDTVCGFLEDAHEKYFIEMMQECRRHVPDFILLNHRVPLSPEAEKYATTFLWEGVETYVDVHISNEKTAPHHRAFIMDRGQTPQMKRLTEDHGVCLSSHLDGFEDDLIIQAFSRSLILAPQIYGNPWLLKDAEQARLARIFNLHRRHRDILVDGMIPSDNGIYPEGTVVRGSASKRFVVAGNMEWSTFYMTLPLDTSIGLAPCDKVAVSIHHPFEKFVGVFSYGDRVTVPVEPFRACLVEACEVSEADVMLTGCEYQVLHENENGVPREVLVVSCEGEIGYTDGRSLCTVPSFDHTPREPKLLVSLEPEERSAVPRNVIKQLETALFSQNHDSLEARSLERAGETSIPQVKAARDAFFKQATYKVRGCESAFAFDGDDSTFFDGVSRIFFRECGFRFDGGCLRVDFGDEYEADCVRFEFFDSDVTERGYHATLEKQCLVPVCDYSSDLEEWRETRIDQVGTLYRCEETAIVSNLHCLKKMSGRRRFVTYGVSGKIRYFRMPRPIDHIHKISLLKDGKELTLHFPRANNLLPCNREVAYCKEVKLTLSPEEIRLDSYLSVCLEGIHGREAAYAVLEADGKYFGAPDRAPGYQTNAWECHARRSLAQDHHYTYYFPVGKELCGKELTVRIIGLDDALSDYGVRVFLCDGNGDGEGLVLSV